MELYLVRHTTPKNMQGICYGVSDVDIESGYELQFEKIKNKIRPCEDTLFISSPLQRCAKLAAHLSNNNYISDQRLKELDFGAWELMPWDLIPRKYFDDWSKDYVNNLTPGNDSLFQLYHRAIAVYQEVIREKYQRVVWVTHAGIIRSLLIFAQQKQLAEAFDFEIGYGSVSKLVFRDGVISVQYVNAH